MAGEDLSEEHIRQLLKDTEERLRCTKQQKQARSAAPSFQHSVVQTKLAKPITSYITTTRAGPFVSASHLISEQDRRQAGQIRKVEDPVGVKSKVVEDNMATAGADWYNLPKTKLTPELKRDLQLLRMRDVLDPKRHYKKDSAKGKIPEYSQVGTIIEGPTEYFSGRLSNKQRKRTLVEEILEGENTTKRFKSKFAEIQAAKTSGKKAHYKKMQAMRQKSRLGKS